MANSLLQSPDSSYYSDRDSAIGGMEDIDEQKQEMEESEFGSECPAVDDRYSFVTQRSPCSPHHGSEGDNGSESSFRMKPLRLTGWAEMYDNMVLYAPWVFIFILCFAFLFLFCLISVFVSGIVILLCWPSAIEVRSCASRNL